MPSPKSRLNGKHLRAFQIQLIEAGRYLASCGYHAGLAGNISVRLDKDRILCTRSGAHKGTLKLDDLVCYELFGGVADKNGPPPTSELPMHLASYNTRPDVGAVVHAHPPTATAFAAASVELNSLELPEMLVLLGPVALVPYATPGTNELAQQLQKYLPTHNGFLLENHGALAVGRDLRQACQRMDLIEQNARVTMAVRQLGKPFKLSDQQREVLLGIRSKIESKIA